MTLKLKDRWSRSITLRWRNARPGSVLILVVALLVLLALIGTAYLSSTQAERYTSSQNTINTEADLLINGVVGTVNATVANSLFGIAGTQFRPPQQEMPLPTGAVTTGYNHYTSTSTDSFLADRLPSVPPSTNYPTWNSISWPLFSDTSGNSTFDSPFDASTTTYVAANKSKIVIIPTYKAYGGKVYPGILLFVPSPSITAPTILQWTNGPFTVPAPNGAYIAPGQAAGETVPGIYAVNIDTVPGAGLAKAPNVVLSSPANITTYAPLITLAANASGDGIADSGFVKLPVGPIDGITYYAATRVIDGNSAINANTAWSVSTDAGVSGTAQTNYGFFRSNVGLSELLNTATGPSEMSVLNAYRFDGVAPALPTPPTPLALTVNTQPVDDTGAARTDFGWFSAGDALEQQLARRLGNPGYNTPNSPNGIKFNALGLTETATLAYHFSQMNSSVGPSLLEQTFPTELAAQSTAWSPTLVNNWYLSQFNFTTTFGSMPLRALLTASNPVANAIPSRLTNNSAAWNATAAYNFGDAVVGPDNRTYVCILQNTGQTPTFPLTGAIEYWAVMPWTTQAVKASINTANFEQLWLGFCHVMTDSVSTPPTGQIAQWQPPTLPTAALQTTYVETQMPMFRSSIRDNRSIPTSNTANTGSPVTSPTSTSRVQLTPMQMMQLRAAIAAINTQSMRNGNSVIANRLVRSRHIVLGDTMGAPAYDVEVFGNDIQPFIGQMFAQVNDVGGASSTNFIAIELLNPYSVPIIVSPNWGIGLINRTLCKNTPALQLTSISASPLAQFTIPAATSSGPGSWVIYDGTAPGGVTVPPATSTQETGLVQAIGKEVVILKPRLFNNNLSSQTSPTDSYTEGTTGTPNLYDLVPVDQIDMTGTDTAASTTAKNLYYRRGADPLVKGNPTGATFAWNFSWPGFYTPYNTNNSIAKTAPSYTPAAVTGAGYIYNQAIVASATAPTSVNPNFATLPSGAADTTGQTGTAPTYNTIGLQIFNDGFPGPNPVINTSASNGNMFPFGGFARNADILQVPYIGAYRICQYGVLASTGFYEMNSVTMDSSLANDSTLQPSSASPSYLAAYPSKKVLPSTAGYTTTTPAVTIAPDAVTDPFVEQIGHFCPIGGYTNSAATPPPYTLTTITTNPPVALDNAWLLDYGTDNTQWHYHWAKRIFDYFTVQAPTDDYFPNVDPAVADATASPTSIPAKYPAAAVVPVANSVATVANAVIAGKSEDQIGVDGVININTAPWPVLAMLPFVPRGTNNLTFNTTSGQTTVVAGLPTAGDDNVKIAQAIVAYRNAYGPFKSIEDLYSVPAVRLENDALLANDPGPAQGDFSPGGIGTSATTTLDGVRYDFEERFLLLNGISNLITTRSDTFTCYVLLQGWRNVGTGNPTLVVQRRAAFILDRNVVTPTNNKPFNFSVPTE